MELEERAEHPQRLLAALARPDARDSMNLPPQDIAWGDFDVHADHLRGLRIGLLLDAGCGLPVEPAIRAAVERGASDIHVKGGDFVRARISGKLTPLTRQKLTPDQARAFALATAAGRLGHLAGRGAVRDTAEASSPLTGFLS